TEIKMAIFKHLFDIQSILNDNGLLDLSLGSDKGNNSHYLKLLLDVAKLSAKFCFFSRQNSLEAFKHAFEEIDKRIKNRLTKSKTYHKLSHLLIKKDFLTEATHVVSQITCHKSLAGVSEIKKMNVSALKKIVKYHLAKNEKTKAIDAIHLAAFS